MTRRRRAYCDYLSSPEWKIRSRTTLRQNGFRCDNEYPGGRRHHGPLNVHHVDYSHLGYEPDDDLECLCRACHIDAHLPQNRLMHLRELYGQLRLFDRWLDFNAPKP